MWGKRTQPAKLWEKTQPWFNHGVTELYAVWQWCRIHNSLPEQEQDRTTLCGRKTDPQPTINERRENRAAPAYGRWSRPKITMENPMVREGAKCLCVRVSPTKTVNGRVEWVGKWWPFPCPPREEEKACWWSVRGEKTRSPATHHSLAITAPNKTNNRILVGGRHMATPNDPHGLENPPLTLGIMPFSFNVAPS